MRFQRKFMIFAAHPDDEILGCGATAARYVVEGYTGRCIILSQGMLSRGEDFRKKTEWLKKDSEEANKIIGINDISFYNFPDNSFDSVPLLEIIKTIEMEIFDFKPDVIFTHFGQDLNIDHRRTFEAVMTACRPVPGFLNPDIYSFYIPSSTDWVDGFCLKPFYPNFFVDVSEYIEIKLKALSCYTSEMREYPHSRSIQAMRIFSQYWGNRIGFEFVEPMILIRKILE